MWSQVTIFWETVGRIWETVLVPQNTLKKTLGVSKESISKFLIGNRFHVKLRILSPYSNRIPSWKVHTWIEICASLNHRKKTKADGSRLIPRKHTETLVLLSVAYFTATLFQIFSWLSLCNIFHVCYCATMQSLLLFCCMTTVRQLSSHASDR